MKHQWNEHLDGATCKVCLGERRRSVRTSQVSKGFTAEGDELFDTHVDQVEEVHVKGQRVSPSKCRPGGRRKKVSL